MLKIVFFSEQYVKEYHFLSMHLRSTSIIKFTVKKWLYLLDAFFVFDGTFKIEESNLLT